MRLQVEGWVRGALYVCLWLCLLCRPAYSISPAIRCGHLIPLLKLGQKLSKLIVAVHQVPPLREPTLKRFLEDPAFDDHPILLMNGRDQDFGGFDPSHHPKLADRAEVYVSEDGDTDELTFNVVMLYLVGGACGVCMTKAFKKIVADFKKNDLSEMHVVLLPHLSYAREDLGASARDFVRDLYPEGRFHFFEGSGSSIVFMLKLTQSKTMYVEVMK